MTKVTLLTLLIQSDYYLSCLCSDARKEKEKANVEVIEDPEEENLVDDQGNLINIIDTE